MKNKCKLQCKSLSNPNGECFSLSIGRLVMQLKKLERDPKQYGKAGLLTPAEIHIIDGIGCGAGSLMSELASRMEVTKGAITQIISRMEDKGFVQRSKHITDARATIVSLTEKGVWAYKAHQAMHQEFCQKLQAQFSPQEIAAFRIFINKFCDILQE